MQEKMKQSFIRGSLTSSAGVFISKLIGLFYIVPFKSIIGQSNMVYYSAAYDYYNILLQISSAGLPFAIAALVAKYGAKQDYKTVMLVRRLSTAILMVSGFVMAILFCGFSGPLAKMALGNQVSQVEQMTMQNVFALLSFALFLVPVLYSYRGFYQGLKQLRLFANSQVLEQLVRVLFLLIVGWFVVFVLHSAQVAGVYAAVIGTSMGCVAAIIYFMYFDRQTTKYIQSQAKQQTTSSVSSREILQEFLVFAIPYLLVSVLGNSQMLINTNFFVRVNESFGMDHQTATLLYSIIQTNCDKLTSIPQVLSIGFGASVVPYMTIALEERDFKKLNQNIISCLDTVCYIAIPICVSMIMLAKPIYFVMYGGEELAYGTVALRYSSVLGFATTITPIVNAIMLTLRFRRKSIIYIGIGFLIKAITFYPLIWLTGYTGAITSSILCSFAITFYSLRFIQKEYHLSYRKVLIHLIRMLVASGLMILTYWLLSLVGLDGMANSRILSLGLLAIVGMIGVLVYVLAADVMQLTKIVFKQDLKGLWKRVIQRG